MAEKEYIEQDVIINDFKTDWCACEICSYEKVYDSDYKSEIIIGYDSIMKANNDVSCKIKGMLDLSKNERRI